MSSNPIQDYVWKVKNIHGNPVHIDDLPGNGLFLLNDESCNLHDRYSLEVVKKSHKLRVAIYGDKAKNPPIKPMLAEVIPLTALNQPTVSIPQLPDISEVRQELSELKTLISSMAAPVTVQSVPNSPPPLDLEVLRNLFIEAQRSFQGNPTGETTLEGFTEKKPEDVVTDTILSQQKKFTDGVSLKISDTGIKTKVSKTDSDDLANLLENI